jgi:hypothetical protein
VRTQEQVCPEFLTDLARQACLLRLARLDPAARQFPLAALVLQKNHLAPGGEEDCLHGYVKHRLWSFTQTRMRALA